MVNSYNKGFRSVYKLTAHLVLVTKYRQPFINREIMNRLDEIVSQTCQKWSISLVEFNGESDHIHVLIDYPPDIALSKFVANLKTVTSRLIRRDFREHIQQFHQKEAFWTGAYFVASTGGVTLEQLKKYVRSQDAPHL